MKIKDESNIPEFLTMLKQLQNTHLEIGVFEDEEGGEKHNRDKAITVLALAEIHEYGININVTPKMRGFLHFEGLHLRKDTKRINIPERSFIRAGYDENEKKIIRETEKLLHSVIMLELPVEVFFNTLGELLSGFIQEYLTDLREPPNHPYTVAQKGSSNPLIDTGRLRQAITYRVVRK